MISFFASGKLPKPNFPAGLVDDLNANAESYSDGSAISTLHDVSGNSNHATSSGSCTFAKNARPGQSAYVFSGSSGNFLSAFPNSGNGITVINVLQIPGDHFGSYDVITSSVNDLAGSPDPSPDYTQSGGAGILYTLPGQNVFSASVATVSSIGVSFSGTAGAVILVSRYNPSGSQYSLQLNPGAPAVGNPSFSYTAKWLWQGGQPGTSQYATSLYRRQVYDGHLTDQEVADAVAILAADCGI